MKKNTIKLDESKLKQIVAESVKKVLKESASLNGEEYAVKIQDGERRANMLIKNFQQKCGIYLPYAMVNFSNVYEGVKNMIMEWVNNAVEEIYGDLQ